MKEMRIAKITGREILDSRGNPTIEADVYLEARAVAGAHHVAGRSFLQAAQSSITVGHFII